MRVWFDENKGSKMSEPDCVDEWLFEIWAVGCDYDGCETVEELKGLVDELVEMSQKARECLQKDNLYSINK